MIEIDGSYLEGGGQILRTSLSLSAILGKPFQISNIRANRPKKGLMPQHLAGVNAIMEITDANVDGNTIGSTSLTFSPGKINSGNYRFNIGTAGSTTLMCQTILPVLLFGNNPSRIMLTGGTHVIKSPTFEYFSQCLLKNLEKMGIKASACIYNPGFYPQGSGRMSVSISPARPKPYNFIERGNFVSSFAHIISANLPAHIADREEKQITEEIGSGIQILKSNYPKNPSTGNAVTIIHEYSGYTIASDCLGEVGKPAEKVARDAMQSLENEVFGGGLDHNMVDQVLIYIALAGGGSLRYGSLSAHARTNIYTIERFMGKIFEIDEAERKITHI